MNRIKYSVLICFAAMLACSCAKEVETGASSTLQGTVAMQIPLTRGGGDPEDAIAKARVIIYEIDGGREKFYSNELLSDPGQTYVKLVPVGKLSIYLIANEFTSWNLDSFGASSSPDDLKRIVLSHSGYPVISASTPAPMFGSYERFDIDRHGNTTLNGHTLNLKNPEGTVKRLYSKVSLTVLCNYADLPGSTPISLSSVAIKQMPRASYLSPASYSGNTFDGANIAAVLDSNYILTGPVGAPTGFFAVYDFYVPEYLVSNVSKGSFIQINAYMTASPGIKMTYKLPLGDAMWQGPDYMLRSNVTLADLTISRNTHYTVNITKIKGFGEIDAMDVYAEAAQWEPEVVDADLKNRKLNVSHTVMEIKKNAVGRIHFWSDHIVTIEDECTFIMEGSTYIFPTDGVFQSAPGSNFHFTWNNVTKTGSGYIDLEPTILPGINEVYEARIWLNAGGLRRQLKIMLTNQKLV